MPAVEVSDRRARVWEQVRYVILQARDTPEKKAQEEAEEKLRALQAQLHVRLSDLTHRYEHRPFLEWQAYLEGYAKKYRTDLLSRRDKIIAGYEGFMRDEEFIAYLQHHAPNILTRAVWEVKALVIAEQLDVEPPPPPASPPPPPPPRQQLTPEERAAKVEQYRARMLERERVQAQDYMAKVKQKIDLRNQFRADLEHSGLDQDEVLMLEQEFLEKLFREEDYPNGTAGKETL